MDLSAFIVTGANDPAKQVSVDYQNDLLAAIQAGSGGGAFVNVADFLASPRTPFVTDDLPAFEAALATLPNRAGVLFVPAGRYFCDGALNLHGKVRLLGEGGQRSDGGTLIRFGRNCNGIVVNYGNTHDDGLGTQGNAEGSTVEGVELWGGNTVVDGSGNVTAAYDGGSPTGHGVRIRAPFVELRDVTCSFFGGDGFNIDAASGSGGIIEGNANNFLLYRCQSIYNKGCAYWLHGNDANAGVTIACSAISCGGGGIIEYSFLGNTHIGPHIRDVGVDTGAYDGPTGTCTYLGTSYRVMPGQQVAASTTTPGTDPAVWAATAAYANRPWVTGKTWSIGAPFATDPTNYNARNLILGLYTEDLLMPVYIQHPSILMGGLHENSGVMGDGLRIGAIGGGLHAGSFLAKIGTAKGTVLGHCQGVTDSNTALAHGDGTTEWALKSSGTEFNVTRNNGVEATFNEFGVEVPLGNSFRVNGVAVVGARGAAVADATGGATIDTEARAAINAVIARLEAHGLIAT